MLLFAERVAWILNKIKEREKLNNIQVAKILGVDKNTVQLYCHGKGNIKGSALSEVVNYFKINSEWITSGKGEPFTGAYEKFPEVCGPAGSVSVVRKSVPPYGALVPEQKINIDEAQGKVYRVLSSGTALAAALYLNIQQFAAALDTGHELKVCQDQISGLQTQIDELRGQVDRLTAVPAGAAETGDSIGKKTM